MSVGKARTLSSNHVQVDARNVFFFCITGVRILFKAKDDTTRWHPFSVSSFLVAWLVCCAFLLRVHQGVLVFGQNRLAQ